MQTPLQIGACTTVGMVREGNEDSFAYDANLGLVVLADGMGGHNAGEVAAAIAITTATRATRSRMMRLAFSNARAINSQLQIAGVLRHALQRANEAVYAEATSRRDLSGMGTTLILSAWIDDLMVIAHVGDSRVYRYSNPHLERITADHTVVQEFIDSGFFTEQEAAHSFNSNVLTRAVGLAPHVEVEITETRTKEGDQFLFCSDGLTDMVPEEQIATQLSAGDDEIAGRAAGLVSLANMKGGKDNTTVVLIERKKNPYGGVEWAP